MNKRKRVANLKHRQRRKKYELRAQALAVETVRPRRVRRVTARPEVVVEKPPTSAAPTEKPRKRAATAAKSPTSAATAEKPPTSAAPKEVRPRKPRRATAKKQDEGQETVAASEESS